MFNSSETSTLVALFDWTSSIDSIRTFSDYEARQARWLASNGCVEVAQHGYQSIPILPFIHPPYVQPLLDAAAQATANSRQVYSTLMTEFSANVAARERAIKERKAIEDSYSKALNVFGALHTPHGQVMNKVKFHRAQVAKASADSLMNFRRLGHTVQSAIDFIAAAAPVPPGTVDYIPILQSLLNTHAVTVRDADVVNLYHDLCEIIRSEYAPGNPNQYSILMTELSNLSDRGKSIFDFDDEFRNLIFLLELSSGTPFPVKAIETSLTKSISNPMWKSLLNEMSFESQENPLVRTRSYIQVLQRICSACKTDRTLDIYAPTRSADLAHAATAHAQALAFEASFEPSPKRLRKALSSSPHEFRQPTVAPNHFNDQKALPL